LRSSVRPPGATTSAGTGTLPAVSLTGRRSPRTPPIPRRWVCGRGRPHHRSDDRHAQALPALCREPLVSRSKAHGGPARRRLRHQCGDPRLLRTLHGRKLGEVQQRHGPRPQPDLHRPLAEPGRPGGDRPSLGAPEVGLPAFMAGEVDFTSLNAGQIPFVEQRMAEGCGRTRSSRPPTSPST
jgi:hypothetical protein